MSKTETSTGSTAATTPGTDLKKGSIGVLGILFFVLSAQAPLTGIAGASGLTVFLGNGAGAPGAYLTVGVVIIIFAVGFIAMSRRLRANGAFYAYVGAGLGRHTGAGAAWLALLAYGTVQACMYGLYGASLSALIATYTGVTIPWWLLVLVTMGAVQLLGSRNVELGAKFLAFLVGAEVAILLAFGISVLASGGGPEGISFSASFSPAAIAAGAPGVAIMFAVASMFGFESTAIYSDEAKDPRRTVARATYLSVSVIAIFFAFITWMLVSYYGPTAVQGAAGAAVESGDATSFFFTAAVDKLGAWAGPVGGAFLITSVLAGIIAFHNAINRYLHSLAQRGSVPARLPPDQLPRRTLRRRVRSDRDGRGDDNAVRDPGAGPGPDPFRLVRRRRSGCVAGPLCPGVGGRRRLLPPPRRAGDLADTARPDPGRNPDDRGALVGGQQLHHPHRR